MAGKLFVCPTPIGNMEDITFRVVRTLKEVDLIAAEDTRNSIKLLNRYEIKTPMTSYHKFNRYDKARELVEKMACGQDIALITDAGTPGISDPGEELVKACYEEGIEVTALPGAAACVTALSMSGMKTGRFCFEAFLPVEKKERKEILDELKEEPRTIIIYEAPHRLKKTLDELLCCLGNRKISVIKEISKVHEQVNLTDLESACDFYGKGDIKGEFVLIIEGKSRSEKLEEEHRKWEKITIDEHLDMYIERGMDKKDAMKQVAQDRGVSKRDIYREINIKK